MIAPSGRAWSERKGMETKKTFVLLFMSVRPSVSASLRVLLRASVLKGDGAKFFF
jgi:hypothetical protein